MIGAQELEPGEKMYMASYLQKLQDLRVNLDRMSIGHRELIEAAPKDRLLRTHYLMLEICADITVIANNKSMGFLYDGRLSWEIYREEVLKFITDNQAQETTLQDKKNFLEALRFGDKTFGLKNAPLPFQEAVDQDTEVLGMDEDLKGPSNTLSFM